MTDVDGTPEVEGGLAEDDALNAGQLPPVIDGSFYRALEDERDRAGQKYEEQARKPEYEKHLRAAHTAYTTGETFKPGQLVQWKQLMRNRVFPRYGSPAVVVGYLDPAQTKDRDGDPLAEPLDLVLGILDGDLDFQVFTFSSKRFTAWSDS